MGAKLHIDTAQRRARLGQRHRLAGSALAVRPVEVARSLVAIHGTDPATVFLSFAARTKGPAVADIEAALYVDKSLVRLLGMRRTMFVVPVDAAPVVHAACTRAIAVGLRRSTLQFYAAANIADDLDAWLHDLEDATATALGKRGEATAHELTIDVPELKRQVLMAAGTSHEAMQGVASRILMQLAAEGRIMRGRPRGSWISTQYRWAPIDVWLPGGLAELETGLAQVELLRRWLTAFGPGTLVDLKWWTGLTVGEVKRALAQLDVVEVDLDGGPGVVLAEDLEPVPSLEPWVTLFPALDTSPMAFSERAWFLGDHGPKIFDRSGNIGPTVWSNGRIVGGWAQRKNGTSAYTLFEVIGHEAEEAIGSKAHSLAAWLGS
ncbi:MAG: hypothetical protein QOE50_1016, partial [Sphingomonadales bacterium]|nr:hypothetical protein [Sphingomonadales bacterium]